MSNLEIIDLLQSNGKSIRSGASIEFQLTHSDTVHGIWVLLDGISITPTTNITLRFESSINGKGAWVDLGSVATIAGSILQSEIEIYPPAGTSLRPFVRIRFEIPPDASLVMNTLQRTKRL